jgi:hypothetical protein
VCAYPQDERKELQRYTGPVSELYEGEQLLMELVSIPRLDQKAIVYKLMHDFEPRITVGTVCIMTETCCHLPPCNNCCVPVLVNGLAGAGAL